MLKRALFAGAALVIGATFMQGAVTPALAGQIKVKPKVTVPKPRIPVVKVKPRIQLRVDPRRLTRDKDKEKTTVPDTQQTAVPRNIPRVDEAGGDPAGNDNAGQTPDFAANMERLSELAQIGAFKENIEAIREMLNISGLDGTPGVAGIREWGAGEAGNGNKIPGADGQNNDGPGGSSTFEDPARNINSGDKMGGGVAAAPSPGDDLGGIASQRTVTLPRATDRGQSGSSQGYWRSDDAGGKFRVSARWGGGARTISIESITASGRHFTTRTTATEDGIVEQIVIDHSDTNSAPEKESGDAPKKNESIDPGKDISKQQDPYSSGGVVVWIPPSCGSAECNGIRDYLKNPRGALQQVIDKGTRVHGDREGAGGTGASRQLVIDQHGLVVSYGAESGPAGAGGGAVQRLGKTRIQK